MREDVRSRNGERTQPGGVRKRAVIAAVIGNFIEWYDFTLYGYLAVVIAPLFFPAENRLVSLMATFAVFGVAFVMRPIGALVFGSIGDRIGRRNTLAAIILITSGATFFIGLVPSYETIGILAPLLLVLARVVQGSPSVASTVGLPRSSSSTPPRTSGGSTVAGSSSPRAPH